ncbi:MAG: hypothetical protein IPJ41_18475 [Phycisphaerales bacterium]|nr:hypothetical protein [Phycisphaerales bacterium]
MRQPRLSAPLLWLLLFTAGCAAAASIDSDGARSASEGQGARGASQGPPPAAARRAPDADGNTTTAAWHAPSAISVSSVVKDEASAQPQRTLTRLDLRDFAWRSIGPANMGGRVADIALAPGDAKTFYVGYATGGLFKTTNRGTTLSPLFDKEVTTSIGAIAIADAPADWPGWAAEDAKLTDAERAKRDKDRAEQKARDPDAFAKAESDKGKAKIVWVGTGEGNNRNSSSWGYGVYRSTDGGATFEHMGLEATHNIPQIAVDPRDPDVCYVAAMGHLWDANAERGLYKTSDGGKTWRAILQVDDTTGCCDVLLDPANPDTLYAAMYTRLRTAWSYQSGSEVGGIFKSTDAGATWTKLGNGLPDRTERIGLAVHKADPRILVAVVASDEGGWGHEPFDDFSREGGVFRSEDAGATWTRMSAVAPRAFYFSRIAIDPVDPSIVYLPGWNLLTSHDGGRSFAPPKNTHPHVDIHAFAIDPDDPTHLFMGSDGGLYQSFDRAETWQFLNTIPVGQFYNLAADLSEPYRVAGGLQDNGTWIGPSRGMWATGPDNGMGASNAAITNGDWRFITGGDGFHAAFELASPKGTHDYFYSEAQGAELIRTDLETGRALALKPSPKEGEPRFRFNWNSPFLLSPHDPTVLYLGGNCVFKLTQRGERWAKISPDLSTRDIDKVDAVGSEAETHGTVVSLAESPLAQGTLWAGTDDGLIHLTTDDGAHWRNVTPDAVAGRYIAGLEPSHHDASAAYAAVDGHRSGDYSPTILMTTDAGATWSDITGDLPAAPEGGCVKVVREDPENPEVLYCGTERGVFVTLDRGRHWLNLAGVAGDKDDRGPSLPHVPVDDILLHPRTHDLILGTHGRSIWIWDDAAFFSACTPEVLASDLHAFEATPARPWLTLWNEGIYGDNFFTARPTRPWGPRSPTTSPPTTTTMRASRSPTPTARP